MNILVINGPNLNMLGVRETDIYGENSYTDLVNYLNELKQHYHVNLEIFQSNYEGAIIDKLQEAYYQKIDGIIINAGAYTHYSYAIYDAIKAINIRTVEVHLSDINNREPFRKISVIRDACAQSYSGMGFASYKAALEYLIGVNNGISKEI